MDIVIDFDGTVVTHDFPAIGIDIGAVPVLKELVAKGHRLILFTMRSDRSVDHGNDFMNLTSDPANYLSQAVRWFQFHGIPLYGIQTNPTQKEWTSSPKAYGSLIIDDAALGCPLKTDLKKSSRPFVDWEKVRELLQQNNLI